MKSIRIHETGGPEKLRLEDVSVPVPAAGEVRLRVEAAGLNFIDTYKRSGLYAVTLPHTLGQEAAGVVTALGAGVTEFKVGDRVASAAVAGACAEEAVVPAAQAVRVPEAVSSRLAAAVMLQGLTPADVVQPSLPGMGGEIDPNKDRLMKAVDALNHKLGRDAVRLASTGFEREWKGKAEVQSGASLSDPANLPKAKDGPKPRIRFHE